MLTTEQIEKYREIQEGGLPLSPDLISIKEAAKILNVSFPTVSSMKATHPGRKEKGKITWWIVGSIIMLHQESLVEILTAKGWIKEVE